MNEAEGSISPSAVGIFNFVFLGGLAVSMPATGPKVRGFKNPAEDDWF
jgi:hypothetical protein